MRFGAVHRIRKPFGRDAPNSLARMALAPGFGRRPLAGFGIGSVREGGSVGPAKKISGFCGLLAPSQALSRTENPRVVGSIPTLATTPNSMKLVRLPS